MTYPESIAYLDALAPRGWRMGLDRMQALVERAGLMESLGGATGPQFIHVAGTNGKGSVTAYLQFLMAAHGLHTGAFYSPFVYSPLERIQLGLAPIREEEFATLATDLRPISESFDGTELGGISEFEFKTAMGFLCWARHRREWVALEVGLGGALDATNVVTSRSQVLVSVGLDHVSVLGHTHAEIAGEKVGVFRPGTIAAVGNLPPEAMAVAVAHAQEIGATLWKMGEEITLELLSDGYRVTTPAGSFSALRPGLVGSMQAENMALAIAAYAASGAPLEVEAVRDGVWETSLPGRFERRIIGNQLFVLDGAHNREAAQALRETLATEYPGKQWTLLTGMVAGHDPIGMYSPLADVVADVVFAPINFRRAVPPQELADATRELFPSADVADSVSQALELARGLDRPVLVTGSFYLLGEVGAALHYGT